MLLAFISYNLGFKWMISMNSGNPVLMKISHAFYLLWKSTGSVRSYSCHQLPSLNDCINLYFVTVLQLLQSYVAVLMGTAHWNVPAACHSPPYYQCTDSHVTLSVIISHCKLINNSFLYPSPRYNFRWDIFPLFDLSSLNLILQEGIIRSQELNWLCWFVISITV